MSSETPIKKMKKNPLKNFRSGENMLDIRLKIVAVDSIRTVKSGAKLWTMVGTDGTDFVNISCWESGVERMERALGKKFLNNTYEFVNFASHEIAPIFNFGNSAYELRWKEGAEVKLVGGEKRITGGENFYELLEKKMALDEDKFEPKKIDSFNLGDSIEFEAEIVKMNGKNVPVKGNEAFVFDLHIVQGKVTSKVTGWNILGRFLQHVCSGKEGSCVKMQGVVLKEKSDGEKERNGQKEFVFTGNSKISLLEKMDTGDPVSSLQELLGKKGLCPLKLRVYITRPQSVFSLARKEDSTIVSDGNFKAQLVFPHNIVFDVGIEILLKSANVFWNESGVLTLTIYSGQSVHVYKGETTIVKVDLEDLEYPAAK